jgi:hypothetical protein
LDCLNALTATAKTVESFDRRAERRSDAAAPRALPGLFDEGFDLLAIDAIAGARRARRSGNGHSCLPDSVELVLLASC